MKKINDVEYVIKDSSLIFRRDSKFNEDSTFIAINVNNIQNIEVFQVWDEMGIKILSPFGTIILSIISCKPWVCKEDRDWEEHWESLRRLRLFIKELMSNNISVTLPKDFSL